MIECQASSTAVLGGPLKGESYHKEPLYRVVTYGSLATAASTGASQVSRASDIQNSLAGVRSTVIVMQIPTCDSQATRIEADNEQNDDCDSVCNVS